MPKKLFNEREVEDYLAERRLGVLDAVDGLRTDEILRSSLEELCDQVMKERAARPIALNTEQAMYDVDRTRINDGGRMPAPATRVSFFIPYSGDVELFDCRVPGLTEVSISGEIRGEEGELVLAYESADPADTGFRAHYDRDVDLIRQRLAVLNGQVGTRNKALHAAIKERLIAWTAHLKGRDWEKELGMKPKPKGKV
jgi:hypothetical protein